MVHYLEGEEHLGTVLNRDYFLPRNLTLYRVIRETGISPRVLCGALTGRQPLPLDDAMTLARYFGEEESFFAKKQLEYELVRARRNAEHLVRC